MMLYDRIVRAVTGTVRYKLLALVVFPALLVLPIVLGLAIYWGKNFTYEQLFFKVKTDLTVAHDIFKRIRADYLNQLGRLADSYEFRTALNAGDSARIQAQLGDLKRKSGFSFLHLVDHSGNRLYEDPTSGHSRISSSLLKVAQGIPSVDIEIYNKEDLMNEDPLLARNNEVLLIKTPRARPSDKQIENRAMVIRALYPARDSSGKIVGFLDGGVLLNQNFNFVDTIRDLVYGPGTLQKGSIGTVTVFLDDVRITTNVPLREHERALGTGVSDEVRTKVLDDGNIWVDRAFVVNDWYISAYEPIVDENGKHVGMLYSGYLEAPYRTSLWHAFTVLALLFVILMILSVIVAIRGAKSIFKPLEAMTTVVHATRTGHERRIGAVTSRDEIGELAREFDAMLDLLKDRNHQIQDWADQLENKVEIRTSELEQRNADLQRTISVLRQTRQKLVVAEKRAALGELTAGVAHEINNPIQVILGNLDMISNDMGEQLKPVQEEIELIIQQVYRIQEIINNLLRYARPDEFAGYMVDVDINNIVKDTLKLVRHLQNSYEFAIELDLQASNRVRINPQELQQVLVNLIVNASHAMPKKNGTIHVLTRDWEDRGVKIRVRDNGMGMTEDQLSRIFNPFYTTKGQGEGTGLGLSVSYGLIRRVGGNITAESKPDTGSEFTVWLLSEPEMIEDEKTIMELLYNIEKDAAAANH